jgi:hypothetical protein
MASDVFLDTSGLSVSSFMEPMESQNARAGSGQGSEEIDLSLLEDSLRLSPWQRLQENERALILVRMLEAARLPLDAPIQPNP